jgi:hypothetical protein
MTSTNYESKTAENPSIKIVIKSLSWIFKNIGYLHRKHNQVNESRIVSTDYLEKIRIISNEKQ